MKLSYKKLWKLLIDKDMTKTDLRSATGISTCTISKMNRGEDISTVTLTRICDALDCNISDILDIVRTEETESLCR